jgi:acetyltransferase-like isoleucine patch superfamily enzyme
MNSFLDCEEILALGLRSVGERVSISRKASLYGCSHISLGNDVRIDDFCILSGNITVGNYIHIAAFCAFYGGEAGIEIGDFANFSSRISIYAISDDYSGESMTNPMIPDKYKKLEHGKVSIGKHVIIGSGSVILPGTSIGEGGSIGALSLVKQDLPEWSICAGIPAKVIRPRSKNALLLEQEFIAEKQRMNANTSGAASKP